MNKDNKYYQVLIPAKIYQNLQFIEDKIRNNIVGFSPDNLKEIISIISCHIRKGDNFAHLKITYIKKLVPQGDKYLKGLIDLDIVKRFGNYIPGIISYKYKFAPEYESKYLSFTLHNPKLIRRIERAQESIRKEGANSLWGLTQQVKYLKQLTLSDDYKDYIESNYIAETKKYNDIVRSATRINNGDFFYNIDNTSRRFHSNITNMAKGLRPYLRIKGESLVNIDIKNSQPYLSTLILTNPSKVSFLTKDPAFAMLLQTLKVPLNKDVMNYIDLVNNGRLYEYLMEEYRKEGLELTRDKTKKQVLRILFARNRMPKNETNRKARQVFKNRFPTVYRIFNKVRGSEKGNKFHNFRRFAILLQRIESYLILDIIMKRIHIELPGVIALTIHDSVMTTSNKSEAIRKTMIEELTSFVGFSPNIKIEENINIINKIEYNIEENKSRLVFLTNTMLQPVYISLNQ